MKITIRAFNLLYKNTCLAMIKFLMISLSKNKDEMLILPFTAITL